MSRMKFIVGDKVTVVGKPFNSSADIKNGYKGTVVIVQTVIDLYLPYGVEFDKKIAGHNLDGSIKIPKNQGYWFAGRNLIHGTKESLALYNLRK